MSGTRRHNKKMGKAVVEEMAYGTVVAVVRKIAHKYESIRLLDLLIEIEMAVRDIAAERGIELGASVNGPAGYWEEQIERVRYLRKGEV